LAVRKKEANKRFNDAKTEDPFKPKFKFDQARIKQHREKVEKMKKEQASSMPNKKITDFIKKGDDQDGA
jgi:hypothetical protein